MDSPVVVVTTLVDPFGRIIRVKVHLPSLKKKDYIEFIIVIV
jgi:hypothetical protein